MTTNSAQANQASVFAGLGTWSYTVAVAGAYTLAFFSTIPQSSGLQVVVNQNGSPILTSGGTTANPTPTQSSLGGEVGITASVGDVITVVLSSSATADQAPNAIKSVINLFTGVV